MTRALRSGCLAAVVLCLVATAACSPGDATDRAHASPHDSASTTSASTTSTGTSSTNSASGPSTGCDRSPVAAAGISDERITSGGVERSYQLVVPDGYDGVTPLPIVFGLHSLTVDYRIVPALSGFGDMSGTYRFIGVAPSGRLGSTGLPYWNAAPAEDNYDLDFLTELLDHLETTLCVDTAAVFSVGMSNGAQMSSLLACRIGDRIAGIAGISGVEYNEPCDGPPVPIIAFHGLEDPVVPYQGGGLSSVAIADQNFYKGGLPQGLAVPTGVDESMRRWAEHNGCSAEPVEERVSPEVRKRTWQGCGAATVLYIVDNGGHAWPGKPQPAFEAQFGHGTTDIDASNLAFTFFFDQIGR